MSIQSSSSIQLEESKKLKLSTKQFKFFKKSELNIPNSSKSSKIDKINERNSISNHDSYIHIKTSQSQEAINVDHKAAAQHLQMQKDLKSIQTQWDMYNMMKRSLGESYKRIELETMPQTTTTLYTAQSTMPNTQKSNFKSKFAFPKQEKPQITQENERKERYLTLKRVFNSKLKEQKIAINRYLAGEPSDPKIMESHKELMKVRPITASVTLIKGKHKINTNIDHNIYNNNQRQIISATNRNQLTKQQNFFSQPTKKGLGSQQQLPLMLYSNQNIFSGSKQKQPDPMKQKLKEFLDKFMKGEQEYFKKLNDVQVGGEDKFFKGIVLNQKYYKDYCAKPDQEFFQDSDLSIRKNCLLTEGDKFSQQYQQNKKYREQAFNTSQRRISILTGYNNKVMPAESYVRNSRRNISINYAKNNYNINQQVQSSGLLDVKKYNNMIQTQINGLEQLQEGLTELSVRLTKKNEFTEVQEQFFKMTRENRFELLEKYLNTEDTEILKVQDSLGLTPLHWAAKRGYRDLVELFILKNAPIFAKDVKGLTAYEYAQNNKFYIIASLLKREQQLILQKQAEIEQQKMIKKAQLIESKSLIKSDSEELD